MLNGRASQEAAEYVNALSAEFAPVVVQEFVGQVLAMEQDPEDRSADLLALIENHDVANEPRTREAYMQAMRALDGGNYSDA